MIEDRAGLAPAELERLAAAVARHASLSDVIRWGAARAPAAVVADVVVQDEFTHDVVLPLGGRLVLVYDTT